MQHLTLTLLPADTNQRPEVFSFVVGSYQFIDDERSLQHIITEPTTMKFSQQQTADLLRIGFTRMFGGALNYTYAVGMSGTIGCIEKVHLESYPNYLEQQRLREQQRPLRAVSTPFILQGTDPNDALQAIGRLDRRKKLLIACAEQEAPADTQVYTCTVLKSTDKEVPDVISDLRLNMRYVKRNGSHRFWRYGNPTHWFLPDSLLLATVAPEIQHLLLGPDTPPVL